jgi:serine/threonine-protein kinase
VPYFRIVSPDPIAAPALSPGYRLDRYELLCPVATGGMASVWLAKLRAKHGFERLVAVKTILPQLASDVRFQQMFLDEARLASKIDHVNACHVIDLGDEHGVLYLVMEWIDGDSLSKLQRAVEASGQTFPCGVALKIVADTCAGLHAAHELCDADGRPLGVVHRDVSPQNVLIGPRGIVKVIDFGIAKARDRMSGDTTTGSLKGKIHFMAPEQALGTPLTRRADVWAAGALLYSLLAGEPPYDGPNQYATLHRIASGEPPPRLQPSVPDAVAAVVYRALSHNPDARFQTAAEMQQAVEAAMTATQSVATSADVAAFAALHLATRSEARKKSVDLAVRAAAERDRVERLLIAPSDSSREIKSLESEPMLPATTLTAPPSTPPPQRASQRPSLRTQVVTVADAPPPMRDEASPDSSSTLDASSVPLETSPIASRKTVALGVFALVLTIAIMLGLHRSPSAAAPAASTAAPPRVPVATTPAVPPPPPVASSAPAAPPAETPEPHKAAPAGPRRAPAVASVASPKASPPRPAAKPERIDDGF